MIGDLFLGVMLALFFTLLLFTPYYLKRRFAKPILNSGNCKSCGVSLYDYKKDVEYCGFCSNQLQKFRNVSSK